MFEGMVEKIRTALPRFGEHLAGDGKYFDSYAKRPKKDGCEDGRGEQDAKYSIKEYTYTDKDGQTRKKKETHYGFKGHIICDVATELPVMFSITAANTDERSEMAKLVKTMPSGLKRRVKTLSLDRGYDSAEMIDTVKSAGIIPVVDIRNCWKDGEATRQYKDTDIVYDYRGNVYIVGDDGRQTKMKYTGYDNQKKCLRYSHQGKTYKIYISYDKRIFLPIARDSKKFKRLYNGRTSVERLNGRLDRDFMYEDHCIRGLGKMRTMLAISMLVMNAMAIAKIQARQTGNLAAITKGIIKNAA